MIGRHPMFKVEVAYVIKTTLDVLAPDAGAAMRKGEKIVLQNFANVKQAKAVNVRMATSDEVRTSRCAQAARR